MLPLFERFNLLIVNELIPDSYDGWEQTQTFLSINWGAHIGEIYYNIEPQTLTASLSDLQAVALCSRLLWLTSLTSPSNWSLI